MLSTLLIGIAIGTVVIGPFVFSLILPDAWSIWLAQRENLPKWVGPLSGVGFIVFLVFFVSAIRIDPLPSYAWQILVVSLVLSAIAVVVFFIYRKKAKTPEKTEETK